MNTGRRWRFWAWPWELRRAGVVGINGRNLHLVLALNARRLYPRVDDKLITKELCEACGVLVPRTYAVIERFGDIGRLTELIGQYPEFVVKPACGAGGRGILVVVDHDATEFHTPGGTSLSLPELRYHVSTTLSGLYSLGGLPDRVLVEERIVVHPVFGDLAVQGTPDLRVICFQGEPAVAMLRLPTQASRGRANLHQGAVGTGVDIQTGRTTGGVCRNRAVDTHPDTGASLHGRLVPFWDQALAIAGTVSRAVGLGYVGVDLVFDASRGPIVLEANARPGLAIQIANRCGLLSPGSRLCGLLERASQSSTDRASPAVSSAPTAGFVGPRQLG